MIITKRVTKLNGMIDIHSHILPGVDDGPSSWEESLQMLQMAAEEGIRDIILTPHQKPDRTCVLPQGIRERVQLLSEKAWSEGIPLRLHSGNELFYRQDLAEMVTNGMVCTLADSVFVLIEFYPNQDYAYIRAGLEKLAAFGYRPILAHAERYGALVKDWNRTEILRQTTGCLYQINVSSLMGQSGKENKRNSRMFLKYGMVDFIATDAHDTERRTSAMAECARWLTGKLGSREAERILVHNPSAVLQSK